MIRRMKRARSTVRPAQAGTALLTLLTLLAMQAPVVYQQGREGRQYIACRYALKDAHSMGFELGPYEKSRPLVLDPVLSYSTYLGGNSFDTGKALAVDDAGNIYVAAQINSNEFPVGSPLSGSNSTGNAVLKLNPAGNTLLYTTYLIGVSSLNDIAVDSSGNAYLTGQSFGVLPTTPGAFQRDLGPGHAFVTKLSPSGNIVYSTYLGGPSEGGSEVGNAIAVDSSGSAYVTGTTQSRDFPIRRAIQERFNSPVSPSTTPPPLTDAFVTKFNPSGTNIVYSTYLGGLSYDEGRAIAVDPSGSAYVTGITRDFVQGTFGFPTTSLQRTYGGGTSDAFLVKLQPSGRAFVYSTYLGGTASDIGYGVAADAEGNAYVTGETSSHTFPTTQGSYQSSMTAGSLFKTTDGGTTWSVISKGLFNTPVNALAADPSNPATLYAGASKSAVQDGTFIGGTGPDGLFKSTDGGQNWTPIPVTNSSIMTIAVNSLDPATLYAGGRNVFKSTDAGFGWRPLGLGNSVNALAIDPSNPAVIYAANGAGSLGDDVVTSPFGDVFKSTDGGFSWNDLNVRGMDVFLFVTALAIDPKSPATLYAGTYSARQNIIKSIDGGLTWRETGASDIRVTALAIDPVNTSTIYAADRNFDTGKVLKSMDGGGSWSVTGLSAIPVNDLVIDPSETATLYAGTGRTGDGGGVLKSTDGGLTWQQTSLLGVSIRTLLINPLNPLTLYAGTDENVDAFVTKVNPQGTALVYSTYLGGAGQDKANAIAVDSLGNAYVTGQTFSFNFPISDAPQPVKASTLRRTTAFVTKLSAAGLAVVFSTYFGGSESDVGTDIATDLSGRAYITGSTLSGDLPAVNPIQGIYGGGSDAFVAKIAAAVVIRNVSTRGRKLIVSGEGFDRGAVVLIDGQQQKTKNDTNSPGTILIAVNAARNLPSDRPVVIQVRNADGSLSNELTFARVP